MNGSGVGCQSPGITSDRFFNSSFPIAAPANSRATASQRLGQLTAQNYETIPQSLKKKDRLTPSRKREEAIALQNLHRKVGLSKLGTQTSGESLIYAFYRRASSRLEGPNMPCFLRKLVTNKKENVQEDRLYDLIDEDFVTEALLWHNIYRRQHNAPPLVINPQLCCKAQCWANHLSHTNTVAYKNDKSVGQNIFCRLNTNESQPEVTAREIVSFWYSSMKNYGFTNNVSVLDANINAGSFTQLVWRNTKYLGIGRARSISGKLLVVANYQPVGNICGYFRENVLPPLDRVFNKKIIQHE